MQFVASPGHAAARFGKYGLMLAISACLSETRMSRNSRNLEESGYLE